MSAVRAPQLQTPSSPTANGAMPAPEPDLVSQRLFVAMLESVSSPVIAAFGAGGIAGAVSRTVVSPLERLKILMQVQSAGREAYKLSVGQALAKMWREEGWRGFMRGNGTNCIRIVPYSAVQFSSYNFYNTVRSSSRAPPPSLHGRAHWNRVAADVALRMSLRPIQAPN